LWRLCLRIDSCQKKKQGNETEEKLHETKRKLTETIVDMLAKKIEVKEDLQFGKLTLFRPFFNCQPCSIFTLPMIHLVFPSKVLHNYSVFTHVASIYANLLEQQKTFA